jgi:hypothetical protein
MSAVALGASTCQPTFAKEAATPNQTENLLFPQIPILLMISLPRHERFVFPQPLARLSRLGGFGEGRALNFRGSDQKVSPTRLQREIGHKFLHPPRLPDDRGTVRFVRLLAMIVLREHRRHRPWSAETCCRFLHASLLASTPVGHSRSRAARGKSCSRLQHSKQFNGVRKAE